MTTLLRRLLGLFVTVGLVSSAAPSWALPFEPPRALPVGFLTPSGFTGPLPITQIVARLSDQLRRNTDLDVVLLDEARLRTIFESSKTPRAEAVAYANREATEGQPQHLLLLSYLTGPEGGAEISAMVLDIDKVMALADGEDRQTSGWERELERKIIREGMPTEAREAGVSQPVATQHPEDVSRYVDDLISKRLRAFFETTGHWHVYGEIEVACDQPGLNILVGDKLVGTTGEGATRITNLRKGRYTVSVQHPEFVEAVGELDVQPMQVASFTAQTERRDLHNARVPRRVALYSGVTLLALGAGFLTAGLVQGAITESEGCFVDHEGAGCPGNTWTTVGGIPTAPLGFSLLGFGGVLTGSVLLTSERVRPWWGWVAGLAVGATSFGLSVALAPDGRPQ